MMFEVSVLVASAALSAVLLGFLVRSPLARHFADVPDHRKVHTTLIPRLGGTAIILTFLVLLLIAQAFKLWEPSAALLLSVVFTSLFLLVAGTLDDVLSLGYRAKFLLQFLLSGVVVLVFRLHFEQVSLFGHVFDMGGFGMLVSIIWMVGLMNAVNIIDGIDGLAAGVAMVGFGAIAALAHLSGAANPVGISLALSGATAGFLYYNFQKRRKVFLGDTGSQFLGAMLAVLTFRMHAEPGVGFSPLIPMLLVGYPLLDTAVAMTRRFLKARSRGLGRRVTRMFLADNDHIHHRLLYSGLTHIQATFLLLLLSTGFAAAAVVMPRISWQWEAGIMLYLAVSTGFLLNRLGFLPVAALRGALQAWALGGAAATKATRRYARYYEIFSADELRSAGMALKAKAAEPPSPAGVEPAASPPEPAFAASARVAVTSAP